MYGRGPCGHSRRSRGTCSCGESYLYYIQRGRFGFDELSVAESAQALEDVKAHQLLEPFCRLQAVMEALHPAPSTTFQHVSVGHRNRRNCGSCFSLARPPEAEISNE